MDKLTAFIYRTRKLGVDILLEGNFPWIYIVYINGKKVTEKFQSNHGFCIAYLPIRKNQDINFTDLSKVFKLIRKYTHKTK